MSDAINKFFNLITGINKFFNLITGKMKDQIAVESEKETLRRLKLVSTGTVTTSLTMANCRSVSNSYSIDRFQSRQISSTPDDLRVESDETIKKILMYIYTEPSPIYTIPPLSKEPFEHYDKGLMVGRLQFGHCEGGRLVDYSHPGSGGRTVPLDIQGITHFRSDALFILLVENNCVYQNLARERFYERIPCIIITSDGDYQSRTGLFLRKLKMALNLPVFALINCDVKGLKMLSFYRHGGGDVTGYMEVNWLGLRPTDFEKFNIPEKYKRKMTPKELTAAKDLLYGEFAKQNPDCVEDLTLMVQTSLRAGMEAVCLCLHPPGFLHKVYIPMKLQEKKRVSGA